MDWILEDLFDDLHQHEQNDRWLLMYKVPVEVAHTGDYSVSYPKGMVNDWAAIYGYDLSLKQDQDDLFEHLLHQPMMTELFLMEGRRTQIMEDPLQMGAETARRMAREQLDDLRGKGHRIVERPKAKLSVSLSPGADQSLLGIVKRDLLARADLSKARELTALKERARGQALDRMMAMAARMDGSISMMRGKSDG